MQIHIITTPKKMNNNFYFINYPDYIENVLYFISTFLFFVFCVFHRNNVLKIIVIVMKSSNIN